MWRMHEAARQEGCDGERCADARDTGSPPEMVEELAEDGAADEAAGEVAGEIGPARDAAIVLRGLPDKAGGRGLREEGADSDQHHPGQHVGEMR